METEGWRRAGAAANSGLGGRNFKRRRREGTAKTKTGKKNQEEMIVNKRDTDATLGWERASQPIWERAL